MNIEQRLAEIEERVNVSERIFPTTNVVINNELRFLLALVKRYRQSLHDFANFSDSPQWIQQQANYALNYTPEEPK